MSPAKKLKSVPADLRKEYGAPFSIISRDEGSRYTNLISRDYTPPRSLDFRLLQTLGCTKTIEGYCRALSFEKIVKMKHHGYQELMLEFYTTLSFDDDDDGFKCRLMGKRVKVTRRTLCEIFGLREGGHKTVAKDFEPEGFWREISVDSGDFKIERMQTRLIKDLSLFIMFKFISHGLFGKADSGKVSLKELFYLSCGYREVRVCTPSFLIRTFKSVISNPRVNICLGNFITAIAVHFGMFDPEDTDMTVLPMLPLGITRASKKRQCYKDGEDTNPVAIDDQPAVDTLMLVSRKLEEMQKRMDSGFDAIETRFDGLEKKVNVMRVRFKTFERKYVDSRQQESNGTNTVEELKQENFEAKKSVEKLRMEKSESDKAAAIYKTKLDKLLPNIKKIKEGLSKISSLKVVDLAGLVNDMRELGTFEEGDDSGFPDSMGKTDSLGNRSMSDGNAEDVAVMLPGDHLTSNTNGSRGKGLSKNGDGNSCQPWTIEDDITHSVKNSSGTQSGHNPPPDSMGKTDCLGNRSIPDVKTEDVAVLLPGVHWTSNSNRSRSKRLPKNGGVSLQPWAIEDDNAHNVENSPGSQSDHNPPLPGNNECMEPLGSVAHASGTHLISGEARFCKTTSSSSVAAGDVIIEVLDSDDATTPIRAAQTSKRVLGSDEMNSVHISKRNRTDNPLIHEKGNEFLKSSHDNVDCSLSGKCVEEARESRNSLNDESFADSEGEALSDSGMEDLIASIWREKCVRKFMYEADMLLAFQQDEKLCLDAVCALYRQTLSSRKSNGHLNLSKNGGFSPSDSLSGCALAEYLIDGDKELRLNKSLSQVKRQQPDVITQCRKLATIYVEKLFGIYCAGDDPLFCQS